MPESTQFFEKVTTLILLKMEELYSEDPDEDTRRKLETLEVCLQYAEIRKCYTDVEE